MDIVMSQLSITSCQHFGRQCLKWSHMNHKHVIQCFPKVARVADHFNRVADQLPHFARPNDPQNLNWWGGGRNLGEPDRVHTANMFHIQAL